MTRALLAEIYKLRRSNLVWISAAVLVLGPALAGFLVFALSSPERAQALGLTPELAAQIGTPGWPLIFSTVADLYSGIFGGVIYSIMAASMFAREYTRGTMKMMLTCPVRRSDIVIAKLAVLGGWIALLAVYLFAVTLTSGLALARLPMPSGSELIDGATLLVQITALLYLGLSVIGLLSTTDKGYLPPMAFVGAVVVFTAAAWTSPYSAWFVWSMAAVHTGAVITGEPSPIGTAHWLVATTVFVAGAMATWARIRFFDSPK